jgi:hypothetical protein
MCCLTGDAVDEPAGDADLTSTSEGLTRPGAEKVASLVSRQGGGSSGLGDGIDTSAGAGERGGAGL